MGAKVSAADLKRVFAEADANKSESIDRAEIAKYLRAHHPQAKLGLIDVFIFLADKNKNGQIDKGEFHAFYDVVAQTLVHDVELPELVYLAASVAEGGPKLPAKLVSGVLRCYGLEMGPDELAKEFGKTLDKEQFLRAWRETGVE